jgi:transposase
VEGERRVSSRPTGALHGALTSASRQLLLGARAHEGSVRQWKRYQAILLLDEGMTPREVAAALACSLSSVYNWANAWHHSGLAGLVEERHGGRHRALDGPGERLLTELLEATPADYGYAATGWTVPLLQCHLERSGYAVQDRTVRRMLRRLGWRWQPPTYVRCSGHNEDPRNPSQ